MAERYTSHQDVPEEVRSEPPSLLCIHYADHAYASPFHIICNIRETSILSGSNVWRRRDVCLGRTSE